MKKMIGLVLFLMVAQSSFSAEVNPTTDLVMLENHLQEGTLTAADLVQIRQIVRREIVRDANNIAEQFVAELRKDKSQAPEYVEWIKRQKIKFLLNGPTR